MKKERFFIIATSLMLLTLIAFCMVSCASTDNQAKANVSSFEAEVLPKALAKHGITLDTFNAWRKQRAEGLTASQQAIMMDIRKSAPAPTPETYMRKIIPIEDISKFIGEKGYSTVGGFVSKNSDVVQLDSFMAIIDGLRLDYSGNPYEKNGKDYAYILFTTQKADQFQIPFCEAWGGSCKEPYPNTGNGFTWANIQIIPEYTCKSYLAVDVGSEIHTVIDGTDTIVAIFDGSHFMATAK